MSLEVRGLSAGYGRLEVLHGVDLDVQAGRLVAVLGANGAGKTTLLRALSGLVRASAGSVRLAGTDLTGLPAERVAARGLAHVPENRLVFPTLSVDDNLALGAYVRRGSNRYRAELAADRDRVLELFPRLRQRTAQAAGTMSGGEQQMLAVARGLMARPRVLVLDEPSVGLAPRIISEIFSALGRLRSEGEMALLLVEQNARAALKVADRAYVLDRGRVVLEGATGELLGDPRVSSAYFGGGYEVPTADAPAKGPA